MTRSRSRGSAGFPALTHYRVTSWLARAGLAAAFLLQVLRLADSSWAEPGPVWPSPGVPSSVVFGLLEGLRYLVVAMEVLGSALLFVPGSTAVGALLLSSTAFATLCAQVFVLGGDALSPLLLFLAGAALVSRRRRELVAIWRFHSRAHRDTLVPVPPR
jgi:hypothetical protein